MNRYFVFLIAIGCLLFVPRTAQAHVVISDKTGKVGAVLHISPDDAPAAGSSSSIFFDVKMSGLSSDPHLVNLKVTNPEGEATFIPTSVDGSKVAGLYVFPSQGVYDINLIIDTGRSGTDTEPRYVSFSQSQRVLAGQSVSPLDRTEYTWAEVLLILSLGGLAVLILFLIAKRRTIAAYTHDERMGYNNHK